MKKYLILLLAISAVALSIYLFVQNSAQQKQIDTLQTQQQELIKIINKAFQIPEETPLEKGTKAPMFSLMDAEGKLVSPTDWNTTNKKLLVFSSTECSYCTDFYPELDRFAKANPAVEIFVIQDLSTPQQNKEFLETTGYSFKMLVATEQVFIDYKIVETPTSVLIDAEHKIDTVFVASTAEELANIIR